MKLRLSKKKMGIVGILGVIICAVAFAVPHTIRQDQVQLGRGANAIDKEVIFDTGDGASNKRVVVDGTTKNGSFNVDIYTVGDGTSGNKDIIYDAGLGASNPVLRWDDTAERLQFSNDGTVFKLIGNGAGGALGGINLLSDSNFDCESGDPPDDWTASGGTFSRDITNPGFDAGSCKWDSNAVDQTVDSELIVVPDGLEARNCQMIMQYKWAAGTAGDIKFQVLDSSNNVLNETTDAAGAFPLAPSTTWRSESLNFVCPTGDSLRTRVRSTVTNPAEILWDNAHLGSETNLSDISQAEVYGTARHLVATNCVWTTTSGTYVVFAADADCTVPVVGINAKAPATKIPGISFDQIPPGRYVVTVDGGRWRHNPSDTCGLRVSDGTDQRGNVVIEQTVDGDANADISIIGEFEYDIAQTNHTFQMVGARLAGSTANCELHNDAYSEDLEFTVIKYPSSAQTAIAIDQQAWHIDGNIGGTASFSLSTAAQAAYIGMDDANMDLVLNAGSADAQVACAGTTESSGLTCTAANESNGISFKIPRTGKYLSCASFTHSLTLAAASNGATVFQVVETPNNAQTISQEGDSRIFNQHDTNSEQSVPFRVCGDFEFASAGKKTLRLFYEQAITGTISASTVLASRTGIGQHDVHWEVYPINQNQPMPLIVNSIVSPRLDVTKLTTAYIQYAAGTPSVNRQDGLWIDSVTDNGVGDATLNLTVGTFSFAPNCFATAQSVTAGIMGLQADPTTSTVRVLGFDDAGVASDITFFVMCVGPR